MDESYAVGQVAALAHVTVRRLHHYDEIGLLVPAERSTAGFRRYRGDDLARLQRILFYRELGFELIEVPSAPVPVRTAIVREAVDSLSRRPG